jgi:hypothetical protein
MTDPVHQARLATVRAHVEAEDAQDLDAIMATWSRTEPTTLSYNRIAVTGNDAIRHSYKSRVSQLPGFTFDEVKQQYSGDEVITEQVLRFRDDQGELIEVSSVVFYSFDAENLLTEERVYLNELPLAPYFYPKLWKHAVGSDPSKQERILRGPAHKE